MSELAKEYGTCIGTVFQQEYEQKTLRKSEEYKI